MKTKNKIKECARVLFNEQGLSNVTLRHVAESLNKSYGNITYHYPSKRHLLSCLFEDMNNELYGLQSPGEETNVLIYVFKLPAFSYDISVKYLFFTKDYALIEHHFSDLLTEFKLLNEERRKKWVGIMQQLQYLGYLKEGLTMQDIDFIMFLSVSVRSFYFIFTNKNDYNKSVYIDLVNRLLIPYLSVEGFHVYEKWKQGFM
jgi:hypothetical protein